MLSALRDWWRSLTDIRRGEWVPSVLLFLYGFLALTSYYVLKPVRNSVFVDRVGADNLPYVYILTAVAVTVVMLGYSRFVDRLKKRVLLLGTFAFLAFNLLGFWWWLGREAGVLGSGAFYIWGKLYPLLLVSQFYLVANLIFTTRQARRLFGPIGVGLILGGIAGSAIAGWMAVGVGTENLLLVSAGILLLCGAIVVALSSRMGRGEEASGRLVEDVSGDALQLLRESSHLKMIAVILGLTIIVGTLIDWQFNSAVERFIDGEDAKTAFFGRFFMGLNLVSIAIQLLATGFVLRRFGVGIAMLALPLGLLVASLGVLVAPLLLTAVLAKGTEGALRYSLDQSTRELLYLPVPTEVKYKVKPLIDLAVYRGGTGLGGVVLLVLVSLLDLPWGLTIRIVAGLALACTLLWALATIRMRGEFRGSIRRLIGVRDLDVDRLIVSRLGAETLQEVGEALRRGERDEVLYALSILELDPEPRFAEDLVALLDHEAAEVRARAVSQLGEMKGGQAVARVRALLQDRSLDVRVEAVRFLCTHEEGEPERIMRRFLEDEDDRVRLAATACALRHGDRKLASLADERVEELAGAEGAETRSRAAQLLGSATDVTAWAERLLQTLLDDESVEVRRAALRAVGEGRVRRLVPELVERLERRAERRAAFEGLRAFGRDLHGTLLDYLRDPRTGAEVRHRLARLLYHDSTAQMVEGLVEAIPELDPGARFDLLRTLNRLRRDRPELDFDRFDIGALAEREVEEAYLWAARYRELSERYGELSERYRGLGARGEDATLLGALLRQRWLEAVERGMRALGLQHAPEDLYAAFTAVSSADELTRQRGYELLDNALPRRYSRWFDPLLDPDRSLDEIAEAARERYGPEGRPDTGLLRQLAESTDSWVAGLARRELGRAENEEEATARREEPPLATLNENEARMDIVERAEVLRKTEIFEHLRLEDVAGIAALVEERDFAKGEILFEEGGGGSELFIVVEGQVVARRRDRELFIADPGQTVGDLSLLDGLPRNYRAQAASDCHVLVLGREELYDLMEDRFRIVRGLVTHLSWVIRRLNETIAEAEA